MTTDTDRQTTKYNEATESGGDARWDELLARPKAKLLLREMAREARDEYTAGNTTKIGMIDVTTI